METSLIFTHLDKINHRSIIISSLDIENPAIDPLFLFTGGRGVAGALWCRLRGIPANNGDVPAAPAQSEFEPES